jgi:amidase
MLLSVLAGSDPADAASKDADAHKTDYVKALDAGALKGKRLGVLRGTRDSSDENRPTYDAALEVLKAQGAELVEIPTDALEDLSQEDRTILVNDFKEDVNAYLATTPAAVKTRTLADLIAFNKSDPRENVHGQDLFEAAEASGGRASADYQRDFEYAKRKSTTEGYDKILAQYNVTALVALTRGVAEVIPAEGEGGASHPVGEHPKGAAPPSTSQICAIAGYPDVTVPMGQINGLPVNISFIGPAWSEPMLLSLAYAYEQASHKRVPPTAYKAASGT